MPGKLIIHAPNIYMGIAKYQVYINDNLVTKLKRGEKTEIDINYTCTLSTSIGPNVRSDSLTIPADKVTEIVSIADRYSYKPSFTIVKQEIFSVGMIDETEKPVYEMQGVRGKHLKVFEEKCIITTKITVGSILTHNATDGEKTIYYSDCIGVQFKKSGALIGYLQLETASGSMNNRSDNFGNENSFTFEGDAVINYRMEEIANYICKKIEELKRTSRVPTIMTSAVSEADELKKFKELLDMGIITQEEFDAKKKQLLGL